MPLHSDYQSLESMIRNVLAGRSIVADVDYRSLESTIRDVVEGKDEPKDKVKKDIEDLVKAADTLKKDSAAGKSLPADEKDKTEPEKESEKKDDQDDKKPAKKDGEKDEKPAKKDAPKEKGDSKDKKSAPEDTKDAKPSDKPRSTDTKDDEKDGAFPSKSDAKDKDDQEDSKDKDSKATTGGVKADAVDKDREKDNTGSAPGKQEKIVMYPRIGEGVEHKPGDTVHYNSGASDHLKVGTVIVNDGKHLKVARGGYHYKVPITHVVHNTRLQEAAAFAVTTKPSGEVSRITPVEKSSEASRWLRDQGADPKYAKKVALDRQPGVAYTQQTNEEVGKVDDKGSSLPTTEAAGPKQKHYAVGDIVKPNLGPHKGHPHTVIHVFPDGKMNIKPVGLVGKMNKYHLGAAGAYHKDLTEDSAVQSFSAFLKG